MASVLSYTPEWLARASAGFDFLSEAPSTKAQTNSTSKRLAYVEAPDGSGPQVFYATDAEIRWGDLHLLEEHFNDGNRSNAPRGWRALKIPVSRPIQQISASPDGQLLAVATTHTCHVAMLPPRSHLGSGETTPLRVKAFQVGPTAHVLEQSPIISMLWHPLSVPGVQTLVTITKDACLRLWELDINNRHSFDQAGLAIDLKKLANATSITSDVATNRFGVNRTFSPDDAEMEVAAACFGGFGGDDEHGWASMTLWTAMTEGDVYAICPLLPTKFALPKTTLPSLSTEVIATAQLNAADADITETELRRSNDQSTWVTDLDRQDSTASADAAYDIYTLPERPGPIPKLQGPFQMSSEPTSLSISDIHVIAPTVNHSFLYDDEEDLAEHSTDGASIGIVCLATTEGQVHVSALLEGVTAEWLPVKRSRAITLDDEELIGELLVLHSADLATKGVGMVAFTPSPVQRYELFVTSASGVHELDFKPWVYALEDELASEGSTGADFRLQMLFETASTTVKTMLNASNTSGFDSPTAALALVEPGQGLFLLTATSAGPHAVILSLPQEGPQPFESEPLALPAPEPRESYQPSQAFYQASELARSMATKTSNPVVKAELAKPLRAKPETLQLLTDTHRVLSQETHRLGLAAADLFRRCERMRAELADQVEKVNEISQRAQATIEGPANAAGTEEENGEDRPLDAAISGRILRIQSNSKDMEERIKALRSDILRLGGEDLSVKERAYLREVRHLRTLIGSYNIADSIEAPTDPGSIVRLPDHVEDEGLDSSKEQDPSTFAGRLKAAEQLKDGLMDAANEAADKQTARETTDRRPVSDSEYKRQKLAHVMALLERETALIDAVSERLARLGR